jgi:hypothetical protein
LEVVENTKQDWKLLVLDKKESNGMKDLVTSEKHPKWRNLSLVTIPITLRFEVETLQAVEPIKKKD